MSDTNRVTIFCLIAFLMSVLAGVFVADNTQPIPLPPHVGDSITRPVVDMQNAVENIARTAIK